MMAILATLAVAGPATTTEITVYNQGFGLIKELRTLHLTQGRQRVEVQDVAAQIDPTSVGIHSLEPDMFQLLEQNYQYDLVSTQAILEKSVGKRIQVIRTMGNQREVLEGTLISSPTAIVNNGDGSQPVFNGMVVRLDDGRIVLNPSGEVQVLSLPEGLISKPTLMWDLQASKAGDVQTELSYITQGMNWSSDYVLTFDGAHRADLQGWVTLNNQSGASFTNAKLKLLAGDVNTPPAMVMRGMRDSVSLAAPKAPSSFAEEGLFEYHLYTLERPASVRNKETKQISLLDADGIEVTKRFVIDGARPFGRMYPGEGEMGTGNIKSEVRLEFTNSKANHLGMPLPKGRFRIYQRDQSGSVQLLGEDNIDHTPRDEKLSLVVGRAFDIVANRKRTNFTRLSDRSVRESYEIEVRNRKDTAETVEVVEHNYADWKVTDKNMDFTKTSSDSFVFRVTLAPNEVKKVTYTIDSRW